MSSDTPSSPFDVINDGRRNLTNLQPSDKYVSTSTTRKYGDDEIKYTNLEITNIDDDNVDND